MSLCCPFPSGNKRLQHDEKVPLSPLYFGFFDFSVMDMAGLNVPSLDDSSTSVYTSAIDVSIPGLTVDQLLSQPGLESAMAGCVLINMYPHCLVGD